LLSNILLTDLDRELERRGHAFCRYADDCNIYVRSRPAGERVLASLTRFLTQRLKLKVNTAKSAVAHPWERKFLGYSLTWHKTPRRRIAPSSLQRLRKRIGEVLKGARGQTEPESHHRATQPAATRLGSVFLADRDQTGAGRAGWLDSA
jgi:hypothetical protein